MVERKDDLYIDFLKLWKKIKSLLDNSSKLSDNELICLINFDNILFESFRMFLKNSSPEVKNEIKKLINSQCDTVGIDKIPSVQITKTDELLFLSEMNDYLFTMYGEKLNLKDTCLFLTKSPLGTIDSLDFLTYDKSVQN